MVVIAGERGGLVFLKERPLATAFASASDFQKKRYIVATGSHTGSERLNLTVRFKLYTAVGRMVFYGDGFIHNNRRMMALRTESAGLVFCHIHSVAALIV